MPLMISNQEFQLGDLQRAVTFDGQVYVFGDSRRIIGFGNYGMPPIEWLTSRGYKQHGTTELDYRLAPRSLELTLYIPRQNTRADYWAVRQDLLELSRPNRQGPITLILKQFDGTERAIVCRPNPGFVFPPADNNNWSVQEGISFIAHDPVWFDFTATILTVSDATSKDLVFPITFPITFGVAGVFVSTGVITYLGSWRTYPIITLIGPYSTATLTNTGNDAAITLTVPIVAGQVRIIDFDPAQRTIVDAGGTSHIGDLALESNMVDFAIFPESELPNIQEITGSFTSASEGITTFSLTFNTKYIGI